MPTFKVGDKVRVNWGSFSGPNGVWDGEVVTAPRNDIGGLYVVTADGCGEPTIELSGRKCRYATVNQMCWSPKKQAQPEKALPDRDPYARAPDGMTGGPSGLKWL